MIRLLAVRVQVAVIAAAMAVTIPMFVFGQTASEIEHMPATSEQGVANDDATGGDNDSKTATSVQVVTPPDQAISAEVDVEIQSRFNEIRREILVDRTKTIDWWLTVIALVLTFFGVVVAIAGFLGFRRFWEIMKEAQEGANAAAKHAQVAESHAIEIEKNRDKSREILGDMNAQTADDNPEQVSQAVEDVKNNPEASLMDKAVASAVAFQRNDETEKAVEKWQAIANIAEANDNDLAAQAWHSIGYLIRNENPEKCISAYDASIRLNPNNARAYNNRGGAKARLDRHEAAISDYDEAIRLSPDYAVAYNNRGSAKAKLNQHEAAISDYDEAIRLSPNYARPYNNRGTAKAELGQHEAALHDYDEAIRLNPDYALAHCNRGMLWLMRKENDRAKSDLSNARNRGMDIVAAFRSEYNSIPDFEKRYSVSVPDDIKKMLES